MHGHAPGRKDHLGDHRQLRRLPAGDFNGQKNFLQLTEGFNNQDIGPAFGKTKHLLGKRGPYLLFAYLSLFQGEGYTRGTDGAGNIDLVAGGLGRYPRPGPVDLPHLVLGPGLAQLKASGAKGIGLDQLAAGPDVLFMGGEDGFLGLEIEKVKIATALHAPLKEI